LSVQALARRYAAALADVVTERGEAQEVRDELSSWESMTEANPQLLEVFSHPTIPHEQKRALLNELLSRARVRPTTANFLQVLLQNHRLGDLSEVNRQFAQELDRRANVVTAQVTTARPIRQDEQDALRAKLSQMTGRHVRLEFEVNEDLIGGVVTRIGSTLYDGSVRGKLEQIRRRMAGAR
jgi:F-type H+-transporting ATPase subunit delta